MLTISIQSKKNEINVIFNGEYIDIQNSLKNISQSNFHEEIQFSIQKTNYPNRNVQQVYQFNDYLVYYIVLYFNHFDYDYDQV